MFVSKGSFCPIATCVSLTFRGDKAWVERQPLSFTKIWQNPKDASAFAGVSLGVNSATSDEALNNNMLFWLGPWFLAPVKPVSARASPRLSSVRRAT
jgi:hypothetical protein